MAAQDSSEEEEMMEEEKKKKEKSQNIFAFSKFKECSEVRNPEELESPGMEQRDVPSMKYSKSKRSTIDDTALEVDVRSPRTMDFRR
jgi:hypothetical protein